MEGCPKYGKCLSPPLKDAAIDASSLADDAGANDAATHDAATSDHICGAYDTLCPQVCPERLVVTGGTRNLGPCDSDCGFNLSFDFTQDPATHACVELSADLVVHGTDGRGRKAQATLTKETWDQLAKISGDLEHATIEPAQSCADCVGKASVRIHPLDAMQGMVSIEREYPAGKPPAALKAADALIQVLIDQLAVCRGPHIDTCEVRETPEPSDPAQTCSFSLKKDDASFACDVPFDADTPCRVAVECLCRNGALSGPSGDRTGCVDAWLHPRKGGHTFADVCTQGETDATHSLWAALIQFGNDNGYTTAAERDCDQVQAFY